MTRTRGPLRGSWRIFELCIKISAALSSEVEHVPDRYQLIDAALLDLTRQPRMTGIGMPNRAVAIASEDRYCRILVSFFVFAAEVVLECARAGAQETQSVPASCASVASQSR